MIKSFEFVLPTKIIYGAGEIKSLGIELEYMNVRKVMIVTDKGLVKSKLVNEITDIINERNIDYVIYDKIEANPKDYNVEHCAKIAIHESVDAIVAFGGGSSIDAAKAVTVLSKQGGKVRDYTDKSKIKDDCLPLITIPTTAGTGSEITFSSVITDTKEKFKFTIKSTVITARVAIIDPELTLTLPPIITASTGIDALTHAIEGYTVNCTNPIAESVGLYAVELISDSIVEAVKNGNNLEARDKMMMGSLLAGLSFSHADVGSVHCMAEALGSIYDAPHGMCNAILLPFVMEYNLHFAQRKYAKIARAMGIEETDDYTAAIKGIEHIKKLSKEIGLPGIRSLDIKPDDFVLLSEMSLKNGSNDSNPRKMCKDDYIILFRKAYDSDK